MKVVLAMVVRDEADILDAHLDFHLNAGVDLVLAIDHRSEDETTEILEEYARQGCVRVFREEADWHRQGRWMTRLARLASTEHRADWVLLSDGDEFWWPRGGSLRDVLAAVPSRYGIVRAISRYFVPRPDDGQAFAERMTFRLTPKAPINDPTTPFRPVAKLAHRAHPGVIVGNGNHTVEGIPLATLGGWTPIELLHFPLRSPQQCARKYEKTWLAWQVNLRGDLARARTIAEEGGTESFYDRVIVDDAVLERGLAEGSLVRDSRLRDALRTLAGASALSADGTRRFPLPTDARRLVFPQPTLVDDSEYAVEAAVLREANVVRARRRLDGIAASIR
jgi:hypothetical protein